MPCLGKKAVWGCQAVWGILDWLASLVPLNRSNFFFTHSNCNGQHFRISTHWPKLTLLGCTHITEWCILLVSIWRAQSQKSRFFRFRFKVYHKKSSHYLMLPLPTPPITGPAWWFIIASTVTETSAWRWLERCWRYRSCIDIKSLQRIN